jgi:C-terminal processing protease CtpA/Prc
MFWFVKFATYVLPSFIVGVLLGSTIVENASLGTRFNIPLMRESTSSVGDVSSVSLKFVEVAAKKVQALRGLDASTAQSHEDALMDLCNALFQVIRETQLAIAPLKKNSVRKGLATLELGVAALEQSLTTYVRPAAAARSGVDESDVAVSASFEGRQVVVVAQKPFGMHIKIGTTEIVEVWPDYPAAKVGVRAGCELVEIDGTPCDSSSWLQMFQVSVPPFKITVECDKAEDVDSLVAFRKSLHSDARLQRFEALCTEKPFGMNVQVTEEHPYPRVTEVLSGFPAEREGVQKNFILTHIAGSPVDKSNWFSIFQNTDPPFALRFNTSLASTGTLEDDILKANLSEALTLSLREFVAKHGENSVSTHAIMVEEKPFGMQVESDSGYPRVAEIVWGLPAATSGVKVGDVLVEVAGAPVNAADWFGAFQTAVPPFGIRVFRLAGKSAELDEKYFFQDDIDEDDDDKTTRTTTRATKSCLLYLWYR